MELLVGTRKGLIVLRGSDVTAMDVAARKFEGDVVEYATRDPRSGRYFASVTSGWYGPKVYFTDDPLGEWQQAAGPSFPEDTGAEVQRTWIIQPAATEGTLWAGVAPAALFKSEDNGETWSLNRAMWDQPTRPKWQAGGGGLALHSIAPWPDDPNRVAIGISAVGVWVTDDGGESWRNSNDGLSARYLPDEGPPTDEVGRMTLCVHNMDRSPVDPNRLFIQFHGGVYRSDDGASSWTDIGSTGGLPSDFGFPMVVDPHNPDRAFVIPLTADLDRTTPEGAVRVFETTDAGETWQSSSKGLPDESAYLTILRQAFGRDDNDPLGLYFGATSGDVFGSGDGGQSWSTVARYLPPVTSVRVGA